MYEHLGLGALDYAPCRYGQSRQMFRGPKRELAQDYCAVMGGSDTYGRFIYRPFAQLLEEQTGTQVLNLGCINAGIDVYARDPDVLALCSGARLCVLQLTGAQNLSNRLYIVHPRRNDRFLRASPLLKNLFRDVDFTEFSFTRHMLTRLREVSPERFTLVVEELRAAWVARMRYVAETIPGPKVLLHAGRQELPKTFSEQALDCDPLFVDMDMVTRVKPMFAAFLQVVASDDALAQGSTGMAFGPMEEAAAAQTLGPKFHVEVAAALAPVVTRLLQ